MTILNGKTYLILNKFIEEGKKGKSVIYATPEGNFLSPKAVENIRQEERGRAQKIIEELDTSGGYYTDSELRKWKQEALKKLNNNQ